MNRGFKLFTSLFVYYLWVLCAQCQSKITREGDQKKFVIKIYKLKVVTKWTNRFSTKHFFEKLYVIFISFYQGEWTWKSHEKWKYFQQFDNQIHWVIIISQNQLKYLNIREDAFSNSWINLRKPIKFTKLFWKLTKSLNI